MVIIILYSEKFIINIFLYKAENPIFWNDALEARLCELYMKDNVVDIFWGQPAEESLPVRRTDRYPYESGGGHQAGTGGDRRGNDPRTGGTHSVV